jgi:hypothetical protein
MKELVGKGKPFYSAIDKAAGLLKRKVGTGAEFMQELKGLGGIKQSEIEDRGLGELMGAPKMTHEQFIAALAAKPAPAIREKVLGEKPEPPSKEVLRRNANDLIRVRAREYASEGSDTSAEYRAMAAEEMQRLRSNHMDQALRLAEERATKNPSSTYHKAYTLPDGENYREMLIRSPEGAEEFGGVGAHFGGEKNILASMRLKDRTGPNGEKLLHLEELQSDWHQRGREHGYKNNKITRNKDDIIRDIDNVVDQLRSRPDVQYAPTEEDWKRNPDLQAKYDALNQEVSGVRQNDNPRAVPDAPFKKNWEEMALKRLIHHAAEKGYHGIVVTSGAEQADRYSLAKHIHSIMLTPNPYSNKETHPYHFWAFDKEGERVADDIVNEEKLQEYIGKEPAQQLLSTQPNRLGERMVSGTNLVTGDQGMKGFYDKKVPNILNGIGKKYGVKTELHAHSIPKGVSDFNPMTGTTNPDQPQAQLHHFPITEEMRKDVLTNGLPLHREGGIIHKAVGGTVQPSMNQMRAELIGKKPTSLSDLSTIGANEAPNMNVKAYIPPSGGQLPVGGVSMGNQPLPIGGIDMSQGQQGNQLMPASLVQPPQPPQGAPQGQPPQAGGMPSPLSAGASSPAQQPPSNILQMTPQGQALNAMSPPKMADGGSIPMTYKVGGSDNMPEAQPSWYQDDGESTFNIDNLQQLAGGGSVGDEDDSTVMTHEHGYADGGMVPEEMEPPKKTVKAYKLFRVHKKHPGKLFPLFVNADKPVEMDKWQQAEIGEMAGKKVKSKIGPLAFRPGWHAGDLPIATHIGEKDEEQKMEQARIRELRNKAVKKHGDKKLANQTYPYPEWTNAPRLRNPNHVWAEVDMPNDKNWQKEADKRGMNDKGKFIAKNAHITDQIPHGGHYRYKTNSNMKGNWLIGGGMKVNRILSDDEVKSINKAAGAKDLPRAKKQKLSEYGFASGGSAQGEKAKKPTVAEMKEAIFQQAQKDLMLPSEALGKHEGKYMHITEADRAKVEKRKHGMRGGVGFSQIGLEDPEYAGRVWGVGRSGTAIKLLNRERRGLNPEDQSIWTTFIGTPEMHTSNQLVFNRMWNKFQEARKAGLLNPEQEAKMLDIIRSAMTKGNAKNPSKPVFDPDVSFDNTHHLFDTFERRRILSDLMAGNKIGGKKAQIFDASKMIEDTTDPRLLHAPSMSVGPHVFEFNRKTSLEPHLNKAFPFMLHGTAHPEAFRQIPFTEAAPDFSNEIRQTKGREPGYMDIVRRIPRQQITEKYLTGLQKKGYKKGGKVNLSTNMDTINLELSRKSKKAK